MSNMVATFDPHHVALRSAAQELCAAFDARQVQGLNSPQQRALDNLAMLAGMTHLPWWPINKAAYIPDPSRCPVCGCPVNSADCQRSHT